MDGYSTNSSCRRLSATSSHNQLYTVLNLRNEVEIIGEIKHASPMDTYSVLFDYAPVLSAEEFEMP